MKTITIVRHGKAMTGATDETAYDNLSEIGQQQAALVGAYLRNTEKYKKVMSGTLNRHRQTVEHAAMDMPYEQDARLNEMPFFELGNALVEDKGFAFPQNDGEFEPFFTAMLSHWPELAVPRGIKLRDEIMYGVLEVLRGLDEDTLVISSGGIIGLLGSYVLDLSPAATTKFVIPVAHTSIHRFTVSGDRIFLTKYCSIPHLDRADQRELVTFA
ncbi:MAG: histidine phosphatase family protein [Pseudomonadota bacterium]